MSPASIEIASETKAREKRVEALCMALTPHLPPGASLAEASEVCSAFDDAVEFAACEGHSVAEAVSEFFADGWGSVMGTLRKVVTPATHFVPAKLPVLPRAAARLLRTTEETATVEELKGVAESDPALAGHLLRVANSAVFGSRTGITRLRDAVMRIGVPEARRVLLGASFSRLFSGGTLPQVWEHSQKVADKARELAELCGADPESAYAAGLLHDLGRVAFTAFPEGMRIAEEGWLKAGFPLIYAETMAYGKDHAAFGADLLQSWQIPEATAEAVRHHHRPECSRSPLHSVVHLAESPGEDLWSNMRKEAALERTGITREQLNGILQDCTS